MYVIFIRIPTNLLKDDGGFYTGCYQASSTSEGKATWIGFTDRNEEWHLVKQFKTLKSAQNKIKFLEEKKKLNGYMWDWEFEIQELEE